MKRKRYISPHDPIALIRRWKRVARSARLEMHEFAMFDDLPVWTLHAREPVRDGWYFSAGIHGDEPGATEGLITWAEASIDWLATHPLRIFPCLNPAGLMTNRRTDARGRDLNRSFGKRIAPPPIPAWRREIAGESYRIALMLHEDYDAVGIYAYETYGKRGQKFAPSLLEAASTGILIDPRSRIEGMRAKRGLMARRCTPDLLAAIGAESLALASGAAQSAITVETPSEAALRTRVEAQEAFIRAAIAATSR